MSVTSRAATGLIPTGITASLMQVRHALVTWRTIARWSSSHDRPPQRPTHRYLPDVLRLAVALEGQERARRGRIHRGLQRPTKLHRQPRIPHGRPRPPDVPGPTSRIHR